jgi:hypothetical protein
MTTHDYSLREAAINSYILWLTAVERKLASRPTPLCPAPEPFTTRATKRKALLASI